MEDVGESGDGPLTGRDVWADWVRSYELMPGEIRVFGAASNGGDIVQSVWWCPTCGAFLDAETDDPDDLFVTRRSFFEDEICECESLEGVWDLMSMEAK